MDINIGYAWGELTRMQRAAAEHADADVRARAVEAVDQWARVIAGMQAGTIDIGSRTPTRAPAWVTLEVLSGGFATGRYVAGGELREHERAMAERLGVPATRVALNLHFLTSPDADALLASGQYRLEVPEEGALLVVAWLRRRGEHDRASALVEVLAPWFDTLRFYPVPTAHAPALSEAVRLQELPATLRALDTGRRQPRVEAMQAALRVWRPLRDRAIALFAELGEAAPGAPAPAGWHARVAQLVADRARAGAATTRRAREADALIERLARCAADPGALSAAEYQEVRRLLARHVAAHGAPGTPAHAARRAADLAAVDAPLHAELRRVLVARLRALPPEAPVTVEGALAPVAPDEAARFGVPAGAALPPYLAAKVARSVEGSLEDLVERGVIASAEVLAGVLPQVTSLVRARTLPDDDARRLYVALYSAFRRRRGLLLLDYQRQVRFEELPWVALIDGVRATDAAALDRAHAEVTRASGVALRAFPYTLIPNKLVTELTALSHAAGLELPLVEELAADIFMGAFSAKFVRAAQVSARVVAGTLYARYFAIDTDEIARLPVPAQGPSSELAAICQRRALATAPGEGSYIARNGTVIEQAQILTTHNLAVLFDALPLRDQLAPHLRPVAEACLTCAVQLLRRPVISYHQLLVNLKNAAYAWRQLVFYLSFTPDAPDLLGWARAAVARADEELRARFEPALRGLELAVAGVPSSAPAFAAGGGRVFTGWTLERHWLAPPRAPRDEG